MQGVLNKKMKLWKNQKGLTLIELLAVIVILGIIAAIAVPSISGTINKTKVKADASTETMIREAALRYVIDEGLTATTSALSIEDKLIDEGYLQDMSLVKQSDSTREFSTFTATYNSSSGNWTITVSDADVTP